MIACELARLEKRDGNATVARVRAKLPVSSVTVWARVLQNIPRAPLFLLKMWSCLNPLPRLGLACCLVAYRPSNMLVYLRDGSAQTILRADTLKYKLQIKLSISLSQK